MSWNVTMLFVHLAALCTLVALFRHSPGNLQRLVIALLMGSSTIFLGANAMALAGDPLHWQITRLAHELEHLAMLLYIFRLLVNTQEQRCLPTPSARSQHLRD